MNSLRKKLLPCILLLCTISCSSEETFDVNDKKELSPSSIQDSVSENSSTTKEFELASNGLEYKLIEKYEKDFINGDIATVINGKVCKTDSTKSRIFLESRLCTKDHSLGFFKEKYPLFLSSEMNNVLNPDTLFLGNIKVNSELFESIDTKRFFSDSAFVNSGDLLLILSNTFHSHNAYFIHVWEISRGNGTFLNQRKTYKFNLEGTIVDDSFMNHSFNSNSRSQFFLESLF